MEKQENRQFIRLIERKTNNNINSLSFEQIDILVQERMDETNKQWGVKFLIKLYQDYISNLIITNEKIDYKGMLKLFYSDISNLKYIKISNIDKKPTLQPLLQNFLIYLKEEEVFDKLDSELKFFSRIVYKKEDNILKWFRNLNELDLSILEKHFYLYMDNPINDVYKNEFLTWSRNNKSIDDMYYSKFNEVDYYKSNRKKIIIKSVIDYGRDKKLKKISIFPENDFYPREYDDEYYTIIDFFKYMDDKGLLIDKNIANYILSKYIDEYCNEYCIDERLKKRLKKLINKIIKKKSIAVGKLINKYKFENEYYDEYVEFSLDTYYECENHALLLFEKNGNMSGFLSTYIEDIHYNTKQKLDLYFYDSDLKRDITAYKRIKQFSYMKVKDKEIPCLLVWNRSKTDIYTISLNGLNHKEIYNIIIELSNQLEVESISNSIKNVKQKIETIKSKELHQEVLKIINEGFRKEVENMSGSKIIINGNNNGSINLVEGSMYTFNNTSIGDKDDLRNIINYLKNNIVSEIIENDEKELVLDDLDTIEEEINSDNPKKVKIRKACKGIKTFMNKLPSKLSTGILIVTKFEELLLKLKPFIEG